MLNLSTIFVASEESRAAELGCWGASFINFNGQNCNMQLYDFPENFTPRVLCLLQDFDIHSCALSTLAPGLTLVTW